MTDNVGGIERPLPHTKHFKRGPGPDIVQILPLTSDRELIMIELSLPNEKISYRLIELYISTTADVEAEANKLMELAGLQADKVKLLAKGQPFDIGEYPQNIAEYLFLAEDVSIVNSPNLEIHVPYQIKKYSLETVAKLAKDWQIENISSLFDLSFEKKVKELFSQV